jgi:transcriptional regulator with XRE-family HTH domain
LQDITIALGSKLRDIRKLKAISQEELAFRSDVSTSYIGQIERGKKSVTIETLDRITAALEISLYDLFNSSDFKRDDLLDEFSEKIIYKLSCRPMADKKAAYKILKTLFELIDLKQIST